MDRLKSRVRPSHVKFDVLPGPNAGSKKVVRLKIKALTFKNLRCTHGLTICENIVGEWE